MQAGVPKDASSLGWRRGQIQWLPDAGRNRFLKLFVYGLVLVPEKGLACLSVRLAVANGDKEPCVAVIWLQGLFEIFPIDFDGNQFLVALNERVGDGTDLFFLGCDVDGEEFKLPIVFGAFER